MKSVATKTIVALALGIVCSLVSPVFAGESCKCPKSPGPGGGVKCAKNQVATCDPSSGECDCTCDSVESGKSKEYYQALIFSKALSTTIEPSDLASPRYSKLLSSFRKSDSKGTFVFQKGVGTGGSSEVRVGVPDWLEDVLGGKGGTSIGPGASFQNCPNGICNAGDNNGNQTVNIFAPPARHLSKADFDSLSTFASTLPADLSQQVTLAYMNDVDSTRYALEIKKALETHTKVAQEGWLSSAEYITGIIVCVPSDKDEIFPLATKMMEALHNAHVQVDQFTRCTGLQPNKMKIIVGLRPS